ncbi:hypothetical protein An05g01920 [Aspergillus niger]|uniref:Uncharacterized protein n=2 Tax=Aspergillus niger TaxID=5061 RepID=A2QKZ0_ASPNC|nr:hypothetical protein An05g01920 [Aspergillus niger]CAK96527.1 hypothetical protein An05g01920 [Aspergillus niger]
MSQVFCEVWPYQHPLREPIALRRGKAAVAVDLVYTHTHTHTILSTYTLRPLRKYHADAPSGVRTGANSDHPKAAFATGERKHGTNKVNHPVKLGRTLGFRKRDIAILYLSDILTSQFNNHLQAHHARPQNCYFRGLRYYWFRFLKAQRQLTPGHGTAVQPSGKRRLIPSSTESITGTGFVLYSGIHYLFAAVFRVFREKDGFRYVLLNVNGQRRKVMGLGLGMISTTHLPDVALNRLYKNRLDLMLYWITLGNHILLTGAGAIDAQVACYEA